MSVKVAARARISEAGLYKVDYESDGNTYKNYEYLEVGQTPALDSPKERDNYVFLGWKSLPSDYERLSYIVSNGTQAIDTGVSGDNDNLAFDITYQWVELPATGNYAYIYGNWVNEDSNTTRLLQYGSGKTYSNINRKAGGGTNVYNGTRSLDIIYHDVLDGSGYVTNNEKITINVVKGNQNTRNVFLFSRNASAVVRAKIKLYEFKIYDNGNIIRYYIPCRHKTTDKVGLYDLVNEEFILDGNNNDFTPGSVSNDRSYVANWNYIPELNLTKETYLEQDISTWTANNTTIETIDGVKVATLQDETSTLTSDYINVDGEKWWVVFDAYTETIIENTNRGGILWKTYYYDSTKQIINSNGFALALRLNEWNNDLEYFTYNGYENKEGIYYGDNIRFIKIRFSYSSVYASKPVKVRNIRVYGQIPNSFYLINVDINDDDSNPIVKYAKGVNDKDYFEENGTNVVDNQIRVTENGTYTVYVKDTGGNEVIKTIVIDKISS